jgi:hypothetical protein
MNVIRCQLLREWVGRLPEIHLRIASPPVLRKENLFIHVIASLPVDIITNGRLRYGEEAKVFDECAQGNFHFLHGESHANAVAGSHSEWHEHVRAGLDFTFRIPSDFISHQIKVRIEY